MEGKLRSLLTRRKKKAGIGREGDKINIGKENAGAPAPG